MNHGGDIVAQQLKRSGVGQLFTLCGGHISPILVGAQSVGIDVIDCRDERNAVFAADAVARLTGGVGVAAVTAGPGVTNAMTALKNAQLAQTPLLLIGGAAATLLKGRGSLQDIDQLNLVKSAVKWSTVCTQVSQLQPTIERAIEIAQAPVPGPVFVEIPVDVLYPEEIVEDMFLKETAKASGLKGQALKMLIQGHLYKQFHLPSLSVQQRMPLLLREHGSKSREIDEVAEALQRAERPVLLMGSQAMVGCRAPERLAAHVERLGLPTWLSGASRGLLGRHNRLQFRHARGTALKQADVVITCGFPFDFRLKYGFGINRRAKVVAANLSEDELKLNRRPHVALHMHPAEFLRQLSERIRPQPERCKSWFEECRSREKARDEEIAAKAQGETSLVNPLSFFMALEEKLADDSVLVMDGGDFVSTAAYILRPRRALSWLDPGVFGTLGVGGGFAVGAASVRKGAEVWLIYGDGSSAYSLSEFDTFVRHGMAPIAVVGNDGSWAQIARDQVTLLKSDIGTTLRKTDYHKVAEGYGGVGILLDDPKKIDAVLDEAKAHSKQGRPVCINVHLAKTDFREGSLSI